MFMSNGSQLAVFANWKPTASFSITFCVLGVDHFLTQLCLGPLFHPLFLFLPRFLKTLITPGLILTHFLPLGGWREKRVTPL